MPLWVEASRLNVLVLGGGSVGARRALHFAAAGARVRVIAREVRPELRAAAGVEVVEADLNLVDLEPHLRWASLVVIAVDDPQLAARLFRAAEAAGRLVNDATDASRTHVVVPYERAVAGLRIAVTSEGAAGTPARLSLDVVERCIRDSWIPTFYEAYSRLKREAKQAIPEARRRLAFYGELVNDGEFMAHVMSGNVEAAVARGRQILSKYRERGAAPR